MECIQKILSACEATGESAHFDLVKAKEKLQNDPNGMFFCCFDIHSTIRTVTFEISAFKTIV